MGMKKACAIFILSIVVGIGGVANAAENIDPNNDNSQFAYGENTGWLNFEPGGEGGAGAEVSDSAVTGYVWAENFGWVSLSCENTLSCGTVDYGVVNDGDGILSGYAWGENVGWINFKPASGRVTIDQNGDFSGDAWGENIGWINFNNQSIPYKVQTEWQPEPTVVELVSFIGKDVRAGISLEWETAAEIDNAGFNILRSDNEDGQYTRINSTLISAIGGSAWGAEYSYADSNVDSGQTYYYKLEDIEFDGDSELHGPISVTVEKRSIIMNR